MNQELHYSNKVVLVLDTSAFLAKYPLQVYGSNTILYTTPSVIDEARDKETRESVELAMILNRIIVKKPSDRYIKYVREIATKIGEHYSLSSTDIDVIALAYELSINNNRVIVITDDYSIQNTLLHMGIPFKPLRTRGIRVLRKYIVFCPACYYTSSNLKEDKCPICGSPLKKKSVRKSSGKP